MNGCSAQRGTRDRQSLIAPFSPDVVVRRGGTLREKYDSHRKRGQSGGLYCSPASQSVTRAYWRSLLVWFVMLRHAVTCAALARTLSVKTPNRRVCRSRAIHEIRPAVMVPGQSCHHAARVGRKVRAQRFAAALTNGCLPAPSDASDVGGRSWSDSNPSAPGRFGALACLSEEQTRAAGLGHGQRIVRKHIAHAVQRGRSLR